MATTKEDIRAWLKDGLAQGSKYMMVFCDTFDCDDYPVYCKDVAEFWEKYSEPMYTSINMQKLMEVYDLSLDIETQLDEARACHYPPRG